MPALWAIWVLQYSLSMAFYHTEFTPTRKTLKLTEVACQRKNLLSQVTLLVPFDSFLFPVIKIWRKNPSSKNVLHEWSRKWYYAEMSKSWCNIASTSSGILKCWKGLLIHALNVYISTWIIFHIKQEWHRDIRWTVKWLGKGRNELKNIQSKIKQSIESEVNDRKREKEYILQLLNFFYM